MLIEEKEARGNKGLEKGGQAGSRDGGLKNAGWNLLTNYVNNKRKNMKEKTKKCDHKSVIKPWLERRNQQRQSFKSVL